MFLRHLILFNPVQFIASFVIKTLIKRFNLPLKVLSLITVLYHYSYSLVGNIGIVPVARFLIDLRRYLKTITPTTTTHRFGENLMEFIMSRGHNPYLGLTALPYITGILMDCLELGKKNTISSTSIAGLIFVYDFFIMGFFATMVKPLIKYIFKFCVGLLLSAIGVLWNDSFTDILNLKVYAALIIDYFEKLTSIRIPRFTSMSILETKNNLPEVDTIPYDEEYSKTTSWFSIAGLVLLGLVGVIGVIAVSDYYAHETVKNIPVINTLADCINIAWHHLMDYFSPPSPKSGPSLPEAISRTSSGGSDITVTDSRTGTDIRFNVDYGTITPAPSRTPTPIPTPFTPTESQILNPFE